MNGSTHKRYWRTGGGSDWGQARHQLVWLLTVGSSSWQVVRPWGLSSLLNEESQKLFCANTILVIIDISTGLWVTDPHDGDLFLAVIDIFT